MGELPGPLKIRGHHLLCLLGFRGLGYSPEFIAAMRRIYEEFCSNAALPIIVVTECDVICASCPHNVNGECRKSPGAARRIKGKDAAVLKKLGFPANSMTTPGEAWQRVKNNISAGDLAVICRRCRWLELGYCRERLEKLAAD